jgi:hypothetical protein
MSGKISVKVRIGTSHNGSYNCYPEWYLEVEGEDGVKTRLSPKFEDLKNVIRDILLHEKKVDMTRDRVPNFPKWKEFLKKVIEETEKIKPENIELIYTIPKKKRDR